MYFYGVLYDVQTGQDDLPSITNAGTAKHAFGLYEIIRPPVVCRRACTCDAYEGLGFADFGARVTPLEQTTKAPSNVASWV
jgi:hypothetical protein